MKKTVLCLLLFCIQFAVFSQNPNPVRKVSLNVESYLQQLAGAKHENTLGIGNSQNSQTIISLPLPDGSSANFKVIEYSLIPTGVDATVKTYLGEQVDNSSVTCRITISKEKLIATIYVNGQIIGIERNQQSAIGSDYNVSIQTKKSFECSVNNALGTSDALKDIKGTNDFTNGVTLKTYRIAIIVTNEFYVDRGNTNAAVNNEVIAIINSLSGVFEREIAVRFTLVSPPSSANIFYRRTAATDGSYYQNVDVVRVDMNTIYGTTNYDLGHVLHTDGGGIAYYGVCDNDYKGGGWSGSTTPTDIYLMAHEVGHQFSAPHTFSGTGPGCTGSLSYPTAFEPGSGSTIMSYMGSCDDNLNLFGNRDTYFHTNSLDKMVNYIQKHPIGKTCGTSAATGNIPPVANAGVDYTIPKNTPFTLIGSGTDANANTLSYTWEQYDAATNMDVGALGNTSNGARDAVNSTTAPLFRSKQSSSPVRTFPDMKFVLQNSNNPPDREGEDLPNVGRTMHFRLTARDNRAGGGGVDMDSITVTVANNAGPLTVTLPNGAESWAAGTNKNFTWNVNNTNTLSANVKILLSIDGGVSFTYTLVASTANNGSANILIPANIPNTTKARVKIASLNSQTAEFFDVSNSDFTITSNCNAFTSYICSDAAISGNSGTATFNLGLTKVSGSLYLNKSKNYSFIGETPRVLVVYSDKTYTTCKVISDWSQDSKLVAFRVTQAGSYIVNVDINNGPGGFSIFNSSSTFNCSTFISSSINSTNTGISRTQYQTVNLNTCTTYYAVVYNFNGNSDFTVYLNGPGDIIDVQVDPAGTSYTYVAINQTNNQITAVSATSDFTSLSGGSFKVYGLNYATGVDTNTLLGKTMAEAYNLGSCILFSNNSKLLTITASPCPTNIVLTNPTDNIASGNIEKRASASSGTISATNFVTGDGTKATYQAKSIELNAGFKAETGTIFRAETGGCN